jgi:hypothetical protein
MADLDFSRHVSEIPAGEQLPEGYKRQIKSESTQFPDMQNAINNYADSKNWISGIGANIATQASNAIAQRLGNELGKNPKGNIGIPLTDFDKTMQQSYETQAHATLGLQASKLITDSNLEMAKANRITPDLIAKTNQSVSIGLKNIFKNAPASIQPNLEYQYGNLQLNQTEDLTRRMISEQREDRRNNSALSSQKNAENAYSFGLSGNDQAAQSMLETTKKLNEADVAARIVSPETAKSNIDTARKSYLSGKMIHDYEAARATGKGEEYLKSIADKKPGYLSDTDYMGVTNNLLQYVNHQDALRNQDEQLRLAKFQTSVAMDPMAPDMAQQLQELKNNVTPESYEKAQLHYINAVKTFMREQGDTNAALASWNDPASFARLKDKAINKGFDMMTARYVEQRQQEGNPVTQEEAEVQVAAAAGGKIPVFVDTIRNKMNSGNPAMMDSAARQMDMLYSMNAAAHALYQLPDQTKAIYTQYKSLRDSLPPEEAAKVAIQNSNQDSDTQAMNKERWANFVKMQTSGGIPHQDWALKQVGLSKDEFMNPGLANEYGNLILNKYAAFYQMTNGDRESALKLTQQEVKENFGDTGVNGGKVKTLHPIEKVLGYDENSGVVPFIQQDVMQTLNKSFVPLKEAFEKNQSNIYWDVVPSDMKNHARFFGHDYRPIQVKRYMKTAQGIKSDTYNVVLIGNSFNWDISLQTNSGMVPLPQVAPYLGIQTYTPNKKAIDEAYLKNGKAK